MKAGFELKHFLVGILRKIALSLRLARIFLPGILVVSGTGLLMTFFIQGRDVFIITLESEFRGFFFMTALVFWATVTWYSSRLIAYNQDDLFEIFPEGLYHTPRILGYACFTVVMTALLALPPLELNGKWLSLCIFAQFLLYFFAVRWFSVLRDRRPETMLRKWRNGVIVAAIFLFLLAAFRNDSITYLFTLPILQITLLFLVIVRRKLREAGLQREDSHMLEGRTKQRSYKWLKWILDNPAGGRPEARNDQILQGEIIIFRYFNVLAVFSLFIYFLAIFHLETSRFISTLPIVLLSLGILLGVGNLISLYSVKTGINWHLIFIGATILVGSFFEPHNVRRTWPADPSSGNLYASRSGLAEKFIAWASSRKAEILKDSNLEYPVYFVLADGGASRSGYWTAGVLSRIEDETNGRFSEHLFCLSGTSGGSLGNAAFFASLVEAKKQKKKDGHRERCRTFLSQDFLSHTMARLLGPDILKPLFPLDIIYDRAAALEHSLEKLPEQSELATGMSEPFSSLCGPWNAEMPVLFINTTRMQDGRPAIVSSLDLDPTIYGNRIDVLDSLPSYEDIRLSTAIMLGARFPYISPAGRLEQNYYVDGGYFDNSGAGAVHETIIEIKRIIDDSLRKTPGHWMGKLKCHVLHCTNGPQQESAVRKVHPVVNDLFAPVKTLLGSYSAQTDVNNLRLVRYLRSINGGIPTYIKFNLYKEGEAEKFPMNWAISQDHLRSMEERLNGEPRINQLINLINKPMVTVPEIP
jgi:predicted acylesterase/phospholipase RssA